MQLTEGGNGTAAEGLKEGSRKYGRPNVNYVAPILNRSGTRTRSLSCELLPIAVNACRTGTGRWVATYFSR